MPELPFTASLRSPMVSTTKDLSSPSFFAPNSSVSASPIMATLRGRARRPDEDLTPMQLRIAVGEPARSSRDLEERKSVSLDNSIVDDAERAAEDLPPVEGVDHIQHPIVEITDIVESGRSFSDMTDPKAIRDLCLQKVETWSQGTVDKRDVHVSQIMAGLTNQLFRVHLDARVAGHVVPRQVLFRIYGATVGDLYDPAFELQVFKTLSRHESAPKLIAEFPGGRIEEYILGPALLVRQMRNPAVVCAIASILGKFHNLQRHVPEIASWNTDEPALWVQLERWSNKAWSLYQVARSTLAPPESHTDSVTYHGVPPPHISGSHGTVTRQSSCESVCSTESLVKEKARKMSENAKRSLVSRLEATGIRDMFAEVSEFRDILFPGDAVETPITEVAFCHNDVQENNILVTGTRLRLIDFEYANFNYPAFDIANFFCEMTIDYCVDEFPYFVHDRAVDHFPSDELIRLFGSVYLSEHTAECVLPSDSAMDAFVEAVYRFVLASHLLWGFWSIIRAPQASTSSDFDFLLYAESRFKAYKDWKEFLATKRSKKITTAAPPESPRTGN